jgi:hypothetical protein
MGFIITRSPAALRVFGVTAQRYDPPVANQAEVIVQLPRGSSVDVSLREEPPGAVTDGRVVLEHLPAAPDGTLTPLRAGEVVLTVSSPEALRREPDEVRDAIAGAAADGDPLVVLVEGAEFLREDELDAVLAAARQSSRLVILRIMAGV